MDHHKPALAIVWIGLVAAAVSPARAQDNTVPTVKEEDPAVQAILETNPTTPAECTRAAKILADLERPSLAKGLLKKVLAAKLSPAELAQLEAQFGSLVFLQMASREELAPEARELADAVLAAAKAVSSDPKRLAALVKQLQDPSPDVRYVAMDGFRRARGAAVAPLLAVLADPCRQAEHANVRAAMAELGSDAIGPLLAALDAADPALRVEAIRALAQIKARQAAIYLLASFAAKDTVAEVRTAAEAALLHMLGDLPTQGECALVLAQRAKSYLDFNAPLPPDDEGRVQVWTWDKAKKQPVEKDYLRDDAYRMYAARFASDAHAIDPQDREIRLVYLAAILEQAAYANGLDKPLASTSGTPAAGAAGYGVGVLEDLLVYGMDAGYSAAATAAARLLAEQGKADALLSNRAQPHPLVVATRQPDRRLRFAAVEAIMKLAPAEPYAGSSHVLEALGFFAATSGSRRALVAGPVTAESMRVGGYLAAMGYEVDTANTGRDLIRLAIRSPDYELALVDASLDGPPPDLLLQQLRHDGRTARLPVGIMARADARHRARQMASGDPLADAFSRPHTEEAVQAIVERLTLLAGPRMVSHDQRQKEAAAALSWLAELSAKHQKIYDMQRIEEAVLAPLYVSQLGSTAVAVLGNLDTSKSQQTLVELASRPTQPFELRRAAAQAFGDSIQKHGILLSAPQILLQYDRYNRSANLDAGTQQVLATILDFIEAPSRMKEEGGKRERGRQ